MSQIKLKICGVKSANEARQLADLGVDYIGLNFVTSSSRGISINIAQEIIETVKDRPIQTVALFRDQPIDMVNEYAKRLSIDYVQLHGNESADYTRQIKTPVIKAIAADPTQINNLKEFIDNYPAIYFVLDRKQQGQGSPVKINLAQSLITAAPDKIFLAGGLNPYNLADILNTVHPYGIDIASGVRTNNNLDIDKITQCIVIIKNF